MKVNVWILILSIAIAFIAGFFAERYVLPHVATSTPFMLWENDGNDYSYINPLLACGEFETTSSKEMRSIEERVKTYIETKKNAGILTDVGVYYRDLNNGPWMGINEDTVFSPGSMLKVPLMMTLYRNLHDEPDLLSQKILYEGGSAPADQEIPAKTPIIAGKEYTVQELLDEMIQGSDNNAALLLYQIIGPDGTRRVFSDLGLPPPSIGEDYSISVREYATFFRILYNATYLPAEQSEAALKELVGSEFNDGLVAGVEPGVPVAHKFGERKYDGEVGNQQLHDCGIVYKKNRPYVLCVMTRGKDIASLETVIADISRIVYEGVQ